MFVGGGAGYVAADPELRFTNSGQPVATLRVAFRRPIPNAQTKEYESDFIDCICWGQQAEWVSQYVEKGAMVFVQGRVQIRPFVRQDRSKGWATEIMVDRVNQLRRAGANDLDAERTTALQSVLGPMLQGHLPTLDTVKNLAALLGMDPAAMLPESSGDAAATGATNTAAIPAPNPAAASAAAAAAAGDPLRD